MCRGRPCGGHGTSAVRVCDELWWICRLRCGIVPEGCISLFAMVSVT